MAFFISLKIVIFVVLLQSLVFYLYSDVETDIIEISCEDRIKEAAKLLFSDKQVDREKAIEILSGTKEGFQILIKALSNSNRSVRNSAKEAIIKMGSWVVPWLVVELKKSDEIGRAVICEILKEFKEEVVCAVDYLVELLIFDAVTAPLVAGVIASTGHKGISNLVNVITNVNTSLIPRCYAIDAISEIRIEDMAIIGSIISIALSTNEMHLVRFSAVRALGKWSNFIPELRDKIQEMFIYLDEPLKTILAGILVERNVISDELINYIMDNGTEEQQLKIIKSIISASDGWGKGLAIARRKIFSNKSKERAAGVLLLRELIPGHEEELTPVIDHILGEKDPFVLRKVLTLLSSFDPSKLNIELRKKVVSLIIPMLNSEDFLLRLAAIEVTGVFHEDALDALPHLMMNIKSPDWRIGWKTAEVLSYFGDKALDFLIDEAKKRQIPTSLRAIEALGLMGIKAEKVISVLEALANDADDQIRTKANEALARIRKAKEKKR